MILYSTYTDEALLPLLQDGNEAAFTEIYNRYWKLLFYTAFKRLNIFSEAEESVQDVFTDIWARRQTLRIHRSLKYYLSAAIQYQVMNRLSSRHKTSFVDHGNEMAGRAFADQPLLFRELEMQIQALVAGLPQRCQLVYRLSREEGMNNKEIAAQLGIAEKTVENQMTKALSHIKGGLGYIPCLFMIWYLKDLL